MNMLTTGRDRTASLSFFHLRVFNAIMRLKSVTMAADELELPQSSLSRNLQTLREHFNDPLFIRTRQGMVPTAVAQLLAKNIEEVLRIYRSNLSERRAFEPETSQRNFRISASDLGHYCILPLVIRQAAKRAPFLKFTAVTIGKNKLVADLEEGHADVAVGSYPTLYANIKEQTLFREDYVCIVPAAVAPSGILSLADFKALDHIVVDGRYYSHGHQEAEQRILEHVPEERVRIMAENFMVTALVAELCADLVLTIPRWVARCIQAPNMKIVAPPAELDLPVIEVKQYWHERYDHDPGNIWLRSLISDCRLEHNLETDLVRAACPSSCPAPQAPPPHAAGERA